MICPRCNSTFVKKNGRRNRKNAGIVQMMICNTCARSFDVPINSFIDKQRPNKKGMISPGQVFRYKSDVTINLHCLTDIHVGAIEHDWKKFKQAVNKIKKDDNARWFGNGDLLELIPPGYKAINQRGQNIPPDEQYLHFIELVEPIKDKCLWLRGGNHDFIRSYTILDFDVVKTLAKELNVPYFRYPGYAQFDIQGTIWNVVSGHGKSGAKNGDLELDKMAAVYSDGHVFVLGHNHQLYAKPVDSLTINNDKEELKRRWYIRGGSFLRYADYARYSFFPLIRTGWVMMILTKKEIKCKEN